MRRPIILAAVCMLLSCSPVISQRGYLPDPAGEHSVKIGSDTKTSVQQRLGDPSTQATFGGDSWYYITSVEKQIAFFDPQIETRSILAIKFDKEGKVANIKRYALKDGHLVDFETRQTPARGRELTFLQQLFNATPGVPVGPGSGVGGGQVPGGGAPGGGY